MTPLARWQAARLAALGTGLAALSHDLRGVLSPALLAAERLQLQADPRTQRSADVLVRAVDRAIALLRDSLGPLRDGLPMDEPAPLPLRALLIAAAPAGLALHDLPDAVVLADPDRLRQAWESLFAHVAAQGASRVTLAAEAEGSRLRIVLGHDGRPTVLAVTPAADDLGGWELVIARDLLRACGSDLHTVDDGRLALSLRLA